LIAVLGVALLSGGIVWIATSRGDAASSTDMRAAPASSGEVVVVSARDSNYFYIVDSKDANIYAVDVSGGGGEVRSIKLVGNFRDRKTF